MLSVLTDTPGMTSAHVRANILPPTFPTRHGSAAPRIGPSSAPGNVLQMALMRSRPVMGPRSSRSRHRSACCHRRGMGFAAGCIRGSVINCCQPASRVALSGHVTQENTTVLVLFCATTAVMKANLPCLRAHHRPQHSTTLERPIFLEQAAAGVLRMGYVGCFIGSWHGGHLNHRHRSMLFILQLALKAASSAAISNLPICIIAACSRPAVAPVLHTGGGAVSSGSGPARNLVRVSFEVTRGAQAISAIIAIFFYVRSFRKMSPAAHRQRRNAPIDRHVPLRKAGRDVTRSM